MTEATIRTIALALLASSAACGAVDTTPQGDNFDGGVETDAISSDGMPSKPPLECDHTKLEPAPDSGQYIICDGRQLSLLANDSNLHSQAFILTKDIVAPFSPTTIGPSFSGSFDGQGYQIMNWGNDTNPARGGLFAHIESGASVRNIRIEGIVEAPTDSSSPATDLGLLANVNAGDLINVAAEGRIVSNPLGISTRYTGLLVGRNENGGLIDICSVAGHVSVKSRGGGVVGANQGNLRRCVSEAILDGIQIVGGIAGANFGPIERSVAAGEVSATQQNGGCIVGVSEGGELLDVAGRCAYLGGNSKIGGLIGLAAGGTTQVHNSYSSPDSIASSSVRPIIGESLTMPTASNTYYNTEIFPGPPSSIATGVLLKSLSLPGSYPGFDFSEVWTIESGGNGPRLRWLDEYSPGQLPTQ